MASLQWLFSRLSEASSYAGLATIFMLLHVNLPQGEYDLIVQAATGVSALLAFILAEKGKAP